MAELSAPVRLSSEIFLAIVLLFVAGYVVHWFRRAFRQPKLTTITAHVEIHDEKIPAFDIVQRLFHWLTFVVLGMMTLTGIALYFPNTFDPLLAPFGIEGTQAKIFWHVNFAWALLALLVIHVVWDVGVKRGWWDMWLGLKDLSDGWVRTKHFLGLVREYKPIPKYDIFMKVFHWGLTISLIILGVTGLYFWNPYGLIPTLTYDVEYTFRLLHDLFAALMIGMVIGHVYFAVIPVNWPILKAMVVGWINKDFYVRHFDPNRWNPWKRAKKIEVKK